MADVATLAGGPYDVEFYFDPGCPFAWQASVWIRRVVELRGARVGWRFISLRLLNEDDPDQSEEMVEAQQRGLRYHRVCAAARERFGNDAVGELYRAWGERYWYRGGDGEMDERFAEAARHTDPAEILESLDIPADLLAAADDPAWDEIIRAETDAAIERTGEGVGTAIVTYLPSGNSLFGPVISNVPDDDAPAFYDALRTFADFDGFAELKRTKRPLLDLPLLAS